ncbi:MAG: outer membrane beta-barrel protein [Bacteroidales bacterium]
MPKFERKIKIYILTFLLLLPAALNGQVLISILLGDALNTEKIEFGIVGGYNRSFINTISNSKGLNNFDLGFYFHFLLKNSSYLSTGVLVKSNVGATGMPVYSIGDPDFDVVYQDGTLTKKIPVFQVPILFHQRFNNRLYVEAGPHLGLIHQSVDIFEASKHGGDLKFTLNVQDQYKHIDAGFLGGIGYKFKKEIKSMAVGINYYYGLVNVSADPDIKIKNSALYVYMKIPIGVEKSKE